MNATELKVEETIAREGITDAEEKVVEKPKEVVKDEPKKPVEKDKPKDDKKEEAKPQYDKEGNRVKDKPEAPKEDEPEKKDEEEFTADDALEVEEPEATPTAPATDAAGVQLSAAEQKFVVDNIGDPLVIRGMRGDKEVELKVFDPGQIPRDFNFHNQADLLVAQNAFARLETKAQTLLGNFRQQQSQTQASDFEKRENEGIRQDVADLQKDGDFPKFKIQPGQRGFDDDPAAKQMAEVLDVMTKRNDQYLQEYQQGRPYKHIGFREAFEQYQKTEGTKAKDTAQKDEDTQRKEIADKVGTGRGLSASKVVKPTVRTGTTTRDLLNRIDLGEFE